MQYQERRASESNRIKLETIVEICGNGIELQPFEAEAIDVSGRGMHLTTAYLPPLGAPLVCRFHHEGSEVLVEGVVAWRVEQARGGDFGLQFTAIDKESVDVLKAICAEPGANADSGQSDAEELVGLGARVRLHIDGLGAPMKAAVRGATSRKLRVGSNLEFLRVGRQLELEAQESRARHGARIDGVDVVIDPQTGVPQLMVTLRMREGDSTPPPSVVEVPRRGGGAAPVEGRGDASSEEQEAVRFEQEVVEEGERLHRRLREQLGALAERAGSLLESSGGRLGSLRVRGVGSAGRFAKRAIAIADRLRQPRGQKGKLPHRVTAPAPNGGFGHARGKTAGALRVPGSNPAPRNAAPTARPGGNARRPVAAEQRRQPPKGRRFFILSAGAGAVAVVLALALRVGGTSSSVAAEPAQASVSDAAPAGGQVTPGRTLSTQPVTDSRAKNGIVANVPLFGEVRMAPTEPVPPAVEGTDDAAEEEERAPAAAPVRQPGPAPTQAPDETWETAPAARVAANETAMRSRDSASTEFSTVAPWGRGKLHLPTIYELALSAPGGGLEGSVEATGFSVFVPDRTVSNDTLSIMRRDPRIVRVATENTKDGARVRFRFRDTVPAYKVRLKGDKIQFLISAPE